MPTNSIEFAYFIKINQGGGDNDDKDRLTDENNATAAVDTLWAPIMYLLAA